jgi:hypothetical protein
LEAIESRIERGNIPAAAASVAAPPTFNGSTLWSVFRRQFEIVAEHNLWLNREKSKYLITDFEGPGGRRATRNPDKYELLQALDDRFGDQRFAATYRCQLTTRTQKAGESMQDFATAFELLAHRAYPTLPEEHIEREAGKAIEYGVQDPDTKIQLLLGGEKSKRGPPRNTRTEGCFRSRQNIQK